MWVLRLCSFSTLRYHIGRPKREVPRRHCSSPTLDQSKGEWSGSNSGGLGRRGEDRARPQGLPVPERCRPEALTDLEEPRISKALPPRRKRLGHH